MFNVIKWRWQHQNWNFKPSSEILIILKHIVITTHSEIVNFIFHYMEFLFSGLKLQFESVLISVSVSRTVGNPNRVGANIKTREKIHQLFLIILWP